MLFTLILPLEGEKLEVSMFMEVRSSDILILMMLRTKSHIVYPNIQ